MVLLRQEEIVRLRVDLVRGNSCYCVFHRERAVEGVSRDFWRIIRHRRSLVAHDVSQLRLDNRISTHRKTRMDARASSHGNSRQRRLPHYCEQKRTFCTFRPGGSAPDSVRSFGVPVRRCHMPGHLSTTNRLRTRPQPVSETVQGG